MSDQPPVTLALDSAAAFVAGHRNPYRMDAELVAHQRDLVTSFGVPFREHLLRDGPNITFAELAERAVHALPGPTPRPDLVIVSYGLPDWDPFTNTSAHLDQLLGGGARHFAVSEQGLRAPFTALRIANAYANSGRCRQLALLVVEQTTLAYRDPLVHETPLVDSAALLVFGAGGDLVVREQQRIGPGGELGMSLRAMTAGLPESEVLVVAGPWADARQLAGTGLRCHQVEPGSYCTSVWLELARHHQHWAADHVAVVLCDTDPRTRHSQAVLLSRAGRAQELTAG